MADAPTRPLTFEEIVSRTREAEAAGTLPTFPAAPEPDPDARTVCAHLGAEVGGNGSAKLYSCGAKGGTTTLYVRCSKANHHCETCRVDTRKQTPPVGKSLGGGRGGILGAVQFEPAAGKTDVRPDAFGAVGARHLAFHVLPVGGNGVWRRAVDQLRLRWGLFTGRKVISVAVGGSVVEQCGDSEGVADAPRTLPIEPISAVRAYLPRDAEVIEVPNRPDLWEYASWPHLFGRIFESASPADAVFYGHAKGVTRRVLSPVHQWADMLYRLNLDQWGLVESELRRVPLAGSLKRVGRHFGGVNAACEWHYSGNFWWARVGPLAAAMRATPVPPDKWGAEAWPGIAFPSAAGGSVFTPRGDFHLYRTADLLRVTAELSLFLSSRAPSLPAAASKSPTKAGKRERFPTLSVIVATKGRPTLARTLSSITPFLKAGDELVVRRDESGDWGATPRTAGMRQATGDYLLFMDDDDAYITGALDAVRAALAENPGRPHVFRMARCAPFNDVIPKGDVIEVGNVSTQCFVTPNDPARLGEWGTRYEGDFDFVKSTLAKYPPNAVVYRPEVVAKWRPAS